MLGLRVGDTFTLSSAGVQDRSAEVVEILSKYVFRFQDSMAQYQARFPERHDLQQVRLLREGGGEEDLDLSPILAALNERRRHVLQVRSVYAARPTPIHLFAEAAGRHLFEAMQHLTTSPDTSVRSLRTSGDAASTCSVRFTSAAATQRKRASSTRSSSSSGAMATSSASGWRRRGRE